MPPNVVSTAVIACSFGMAPSTLNVLPMARVLIEGKPAATVVDASPIMNIPPFGMCTTMSNPTVAAATAAALGVLTPMPCVPITTPWQPGQPKTLIGGKPALAMGSSCNCAFGGVIQIGFAGSVRTQTG